LQPVQYNFTIFILLQNILMVQPDAEQQMLSERVGLLETELKKLTGIVQRQQRQIDYHTNKVQFFMTPNPDLKPNFGKYFHFNLN